MGILLGLLTALAWGSSDFFARFAARRIGALRTTLYMQLAGFFLLTIFLPYIGGWGHLADGSGWHPWAWGALAGVVNGVSTLALYRSFEIGKMAVVAPLSASYPVLTVLLSLLTGEHLTAIRVAGIVLTLAGAVLVVRGETPPGEGAENTSPSTPAPGNNTSRGIGWAILSGSGFGVLFWLLGTWIVPNVGTAATVWMIRLTSSVLTVIVILVLRQPIAPPREGSVNSWLLGMGVLDTGAFVLNNRGMLIEQVSVMGVLASLYGAVTVTLAAVFLRERLSRWQWAGIVLIFGGIYSISR
jgi:drug/metabolite transporter (DMT)-like permease